MTIRMFTRPASSIVILILPEGVTRNLISKMAVTKLEVLISQAVNMPLDTVLETTNKI
jgi:hypothetical protein